MAVCQLTHDSLLGKQLKADLLKTQDNGPKHVHASVQKVAELCTAKVESLKRRGDVTAGQLIATRASYLTNARGLNTDDGQTAPLDEVCLRPSFVEQTANIARRTSSRTSRGT